MKAIALSIPLVFLASAGFAQSLPDSLTMSCESARQLVSQRGAVVLASGPVIFDRYVSTGLSCDPTQMTRPAWVPTKDTRQCFVGYRCTDRVPRGGR